MERHDEDVRGLRRGVGDNIIPNLVHEWLMWSSHINLERELLFIIITRDSNGNFAKSFEV